jgi:acetyl-CoA carboxylase, biotin carboxylase subunit
MKILIANRGEIAIRLIRACRELGLATVAVYSELDAYSLHVRLADEAIQLGTKDAYRDIPAVLKAAKQAGAQAVHPGYGFLSENADFARVVEEAGMVFIGPQPEMIALFGDKVASRQAAKDAGLPVIPGTEEPLPTEVPLSYAESVQYPVLVKAAAGGGGRGIRLARSPQELQSVIDEARSEAAANFGDDTVFLESMVQQARHIEVQVLGDGQGRVLCLGERECSIQRRRQKLIEEAPAPGLPDQLRHALYDAAFRLCRGLNYRSLGTVEFLVDQSGQFFFIELNPRLQVEHPVTEYVTGVDLVREQIVLALGGPLRYRQSQISLHGAAIEARILAEDPAAGFIPSSGTILYVKEPGGPGIRLDSALYQGMPVTPAYDSLLAKLTAWGESRTAAIHRMQGALQEFHIAGVATDLEFLRQVIESSQFRAGTVNTDYLDTFKPAIQVREETLEKEVALAAALFFRNQQASSVEKKLDTSNHWRQAAWREQLMGGG